MTSKEGLAKRLAEGRIKADKREGRTLRKRWSRKMGGAAASKLDYVI